MFIRYFWQFIEQKKGYQSDLIFDFILIALTVDIICARLYYVVFEWEDYVGNPIKIFAIREGGLAIYGGVIGRWGNFMN